MTTPTVTLSAWSKLPPHHACYALFRGARYPRPGYVVTMAAPVRVVEVQNGRATELAVLVCGRARVWPIRMFVGEWCVMELEPPRPATLAQTARKVGA